MDPEPPTDPASPGSPAAAAPPARHRLPQHPPPRRHRRRPRPPRPPPSDHRSPPLPQLVTELRDLVVSYVKQQTLVPLQQLGRYIGFGLAGSLLLGFGVVFLAMSGLRALQEETGDTFTGDWSWVPVRDRDLRADVGRRTRLARPRRAPIEEGGAQRMTPATDQPGRPGRHPGRHRGQAPADQARHRHHHRHRCRRGQGRHDRGRGARRRARVLVRPAARAQEEHHRRDPPHLMRRF